jgi:hypothetical protein
MDSVSDGSRTATSCWARAYSGLGGVGAGASEGGLPHGGGGAESALAQTECGGHCW